MNLRKKGEPKPQLGDLIEISRPLFTHWAIYVGRGYVVHLVPSGGISGAGGSGIMNAAANRAIVKKERLCDVVGKDEYKVNNKHDNKYKPLPPSKIVQEAEKLVGQVMSYSVTSQNCEHFVNELRYGVPRSDQEAVKFDTCSVFTLKLTFTFAAESFIEEHAESTWHLAGLGTGDTGKMKTRWQCGTGQAHFSDDTCCHTLCHEHISDLQQEKWG
ncbi:hypothetical protein MJT46_016553 [Ovis ammon polii x Ovis aries]|nr:hypothetical protein MJT46_016553 [Ovis ammon polii x Ovis aries]